MSKSKEKCPHCKGEIVIKDGHIVSGEEANELIHWEDKYTFGIPEIDEQHEGFVDIVNEMYLALKNNNEDQSFVAACLRKLYEYVEVHFATEERLFTPTDYPKAQLHKEKHKRFISYLEILDVELKTSMFQLRPALKFLVQWFAQHVQDVDRGYVEYIKKG